MVSPPHRLGRPPSAAAAACLFSPPIGQWGLLPCRLQAVKTPSHHILGQWGGAACLPNDAFSPPASCPPHHLPTRAFPRGDPSLPCLQTAFFFSFLLTNAWQVFLLRGLLILRCSVTAWEHRRVAFHAWGIMGSPPPPRPLTPRHAQIRACRAASGVLHPAAGPVRVNKCLASRLLGIFTGTVSHLTLR